MKKQFVLYILIPLLLIMTLSIFGPVLLTNYTDKQILENVGVEPAGNLPEGYRYRLTANERIHILSMALQNRTLPQSAHFAAMREKPAGTGVSDPAASFAYTENLQGSSSQELTKEKAIAACGEELAALCELGVIPSCRFDPETDSYDIQLYSAIDMLEPRKNVSVWQITYGQAQPVSIYQDALLEAYLDAETGKLYGFSLRTKEPMQNFDADALIQAWCGRGSLETAEAYPENNPLTETTPYYQKYALEGMDGTKTVVTPGYYQGINEYFLRIF